MSSFEISSYALYVSVQAVELRFNEDPDFGTARFICAQTNYQQILDFGLELAKSKGIPLINYTKQSTRIYN